MHGAKRVPAASPVHGPALLSRFPGLCVVVVGDVCLDRYVVGRPSRMSREAPVVVLEWIREYSLPGEASNPALNLASLGARASLVGVMGEDPAGAELRASLVRRGVGAESLLALPERRTTVKTRVLAEGTLSVPQQVARLDRADVSGLDEELERELCARTRELGAEADAILLSDYKRGVVSQRVIECAREAATGRGTLATVDSQGDLLRFRGFDCVRCNRAEAEAVIGARLTAEEDFERELPRLRERVGCGALVVTRDVDGVSWHSLEAGYGHTPAVPVPVADGVGAGDTVIAVLTLALVAGAPLRLAAEVANRAAALVVQHVGNACPSVEELLGMLQDDGRS
jgi:rfaE bifunctional protein kinase chain/domain